MINVEIIEVEYNPLDIEIEELETEYGKDDDNVEDK